MSTYHDYPPPARKPFTGALWPILFLGLLAIVLYWRFWPERGGNGLDPGAEPRPVTPRGDLAEDEKATIALYKQSAPSVVHVTRYENSTDFDLNVLQIQSGTGSGFVWDDDGHVVTNFHVVNGADACQVVLADHSQWKATIVGAAPNSNVAVLKIDAPKNKLHPLLVGSSHDLQVGQKAYAIGNPFGLDQSLTTGVVSALDRDLVAQNGRTIKGAIQTNAAINPGNSGGPLLDSAGRLIGINTAILSPSGASAGIGFALPVDEVNRIVPEVIRHGSIARPALGVHILKQVDVEGAVVRGVVRGGPAARAGIRQWDIIVAIDDKPIKSFEDLRAIMDGHKVGDTVSVTVQRQDERKVFQITLVAA